MASRVETDFSYFNVWTFRGPKIIRFETFRERDQALAAVGLAQHLSESNVRELPL